MLSGCLDRKMQYSIGSKAMSTWDEEDNHTELGQYKLHNRHNNNKKNSLKPQHTHNK